MTPVSSTANTIDQSIFFAEKKNKNALLVHLLKDKEVKSALVFTRTKHGADKVVKILATANVKAAAIHGNKSQNARQAASPAMAAEIQAMILPTQDQATSSRPSDTPTSCVCSWKRPRTSRR